MPSVYEYATEWTIPQLKKEYTRLRDAFQKQIGRLAQVDQSRKIQAFLPGGYKHQRTIKEIENLRGRKNWSEKQSGKIGPDELQNCRSCGPPDPCPSAEEQLSEKTQYNL